MNPGRLPWAGMNDAFGVSTASAERSRVCMEEFCPAPLLRNAELPALICGSNSDIETVCRLLAFLRAAFGFEQATGGAGGGLVRRFGRFGRRGGGLRQWSSAAFFAG
jgi:hypothetical protein